MLALLSAFLTGTSGKLLLISSFYLFGEFFSGGGDEDIARENEKGLERCGYAKQKAEDGHRRAQLKRAHFGHVADDNGLVVLPCTSVISLDLQSYTPLDLADILVVFCLCMC